MAPQPSVYSRKKIIDAAFQLLRKKGWSEVSTRSIAEKLGSSTMPIYSNFSSLDILEKELREKSYELLKKFQKRSYTEHSLLNLALGYIIFARDEKKLFRFLYFEKPTKIDWEKMSGMKETFFKEFGEDSKEGKELAKIKPMNQDVLVRYNWIFTHGLASMANSGLFDEMSDNLILDYLKNAGEAFYLLGNKLKNDEQKKK